MAVILQQAASPCIFGSASLGNTPTMAGDKFCGIHRGDLANKHAMELVDSLVSRVARGTSDKQET